MKRIDLDLLIIGGGIQGLTLLNRYRDEQGGSVLLVSRDRLGDGETLHSHGYLHRGYFLSPEEASLIPDHVESFDWWSAWMRRQGIRYQDTPPVYFDLPADRYEAITGAWMQANLPFEDVGDWPAPLRGGACSRTKERRLVTIHDRLIEPWKIVAALSRPLQRHLMRGEVAGITWDPRINRITECRVATAMGDISIRPRNIVLAAGRRIQPLLRGITGPDGVCPLRDLMRDFNLVRDVPMILIRGAELPALTGWFFLDAPITMMTHAAEGNEKMWVVTPMEGHTTSRGDFAREKLAPDTAMIGNTLKALWEMIPDMRNLAGKLRFSAYNGAKIDHPEGMRRWFIGDGGIENLRFVWPVFWGLAHGAGREVLRTLPHSPPPGGGSRREPGRFVADELPSPLGVEAGEEKRLSSSLKWHTLEQWKQMQGLEL